MFRTRGVESGFEACGEICVTSLTVGMLVYYGLCSVVVGQKTYASLSSPSTRSNITLSSSSTIFVNSVIYSFICLTANSFFFCCASTKPRKSLELTSASSPGKYHTSPNLVHCQYTFNYLLRLHSATSTRFSILLFILINHLRQSLNRFRLSLFGSRLLAAFCFLFDKEAITRLSLFVCDFIFRGICLLSRSFRWQNDVACDVLECDVFKGGMQIK